MEVLKQSGSIYARAVTTCGAWQWQEGDRDEKEFSLQFSPTSTRNQWLDPHKFISEAEYRKVPALAKNGNDNDSSIVMPSCAFLPTLLPATLTPTLPSPPLLPSPLTPTTMERTLNRKQRVTLEEEQTLRLFQTLLSICKCCFPLRHLPFTLPASCLSFLTALSVVWSCFYFVSLGIMGLVLLPL